MNWKEILALVASIGTIASPIDIIPDFLGPLGLADDAVAVVVAGITLYKAVKTLRAARAAKAAGEAAGDAAKGAPKPPPASPAPGGPGKGPRIIVDPPEQGGRR
ncbi:DUF1232 domain-containing protein [Myceligenerans crystallogenes]|uniref:DUF1232 domain-containing protein n=1 Tax=Myceligenerans crystallogenes TaxID=316335 RepID=A0ABP5A3C4_9MICO